MQEKNKNSQRQFYLFAFLSSLLASIFGYGFGVGNQSEQLPIIMRAMDSTFLPLDAFVNASAAYGPRYFFAHFVAIIARSLGLPITFFLLTWLGNLGIAWISGRIAQIFFVEKKYAPFFAIIAVLCAKTFWLGYSNIVYRIFLEPMHLALPLAMIGFWAMLKNRPVLISLTCGLAAIFHPLFGLESGLIFLAILSAETFILRVETRDSTDKKELLISIGGFLLISMLLLYPYHQQPAIPASQFIHILAVFRHPHHYLPSTFPLTHYLQAAVFLFAVLLTWKNILIHFPSVKQYQRKLTLLSGILFILALAGYIFVEWIPIRLFASVQTFRLLIWIKWLGLILLGGWIGSLRSKDTQEENSRHLSSWTFMLGLITPLSMAMAAAADQIYQRLWHKNYTKLLRLMQSLTPFALLLSTLIYEMDDRNALLLIFLLFLVSMQDAFSKNWQITLGSISLVGLFLLVYLRILPIAGLDAYTVFDKPNFTLEAQNSEELQVARFLKENTPTEAVIFTNPSFGELRYTAERALVVSFESFPFQDQAMLDWYERLIFCYGQPQENGFDAIPEMRDAFTALTGDDLIRIQQRYPFTHAVLYSSMETRFQVLFQTETYKIIQVTQ